MSETSNTTRIDRQPLAPGNTLCTDQAPCAACVTADQPTTEQLATLAATIVKIAVAADVTHGDMAMSGPEVQHIGETTAERVVALLDAYDKAMGRLTDVRTALEHWEDMALKPGSKAAALRDDIRAAYGEDS